MRSIYWEAGRDSLWLLGYWRGIQGSKEGQSNWPQYQEEIDHCPLYFKCDSMLSISDVDLMKEEPDMEALGSFRPIVGLLRRCLTPWPFVPRGSLISSGLCGIWDKA
jgi:hypothetical protein